MQTKEGAAAQRYIYCLAASVSLMTFCVYLFSLKNGYVDWDDSHYIIENTHIRSLDCALIKWAFLDFYQANWHPLTWISHALDFAFWGLNPLGHHLTNNILHSLNTFLVVVLAAKLIEIGKRTRDAAISAGNLKSELFKSDACRFTSTAAVTTGLLFGLHPLHVESVAWVAERKDVLCALFFLLSFKQYLLYVNSRLGRCESNCLMGWQGRGRYCLCLIYFVFALLSKPMAVSLPLVFLIVDWYPIGRITSLQSARFALVEKIPFLVLSLGSSMLTILAQREGAVWKCPPPLSIRLFTAAKGLVAYLYNMVLPLNLVPFHPYSNVKSQYYSIEYALAVALVIGATVVALLITGRSRIWLAAWCYYLITLAPVIGILQVGLQSRADRYTYLPSLSPFIITGLGAARLSMMTKVAGKRRGLESFAGATAIILLVFMSYLTIKQIRVWRNGVVFWNYVIEKNPKEVPIAYLIRGTLLGKAGEIDRAIADFDTTIAMSPVSLTVFMDPAYFASAYRNRGYSYWLQQRYDRARSDFQRACDLGDKDGCKSLPSVFFR